MDSETVIAIFTAVGATKLLEPTTQAIGERIKDDLGKIGSKAKAKLEKISISENAEPNYRVLNAISKEGAFCNDELMAEYFGGVLASSLSEISRDDRGASFASLIGRLTTYQIRSHYIFYSAVKNLFNGRTDVTFLSQKYRNKLEVFISKNAYNLAMKFTENEFPLVILPSVMSGLARENLIEKDFEIVGGEKTAYCGGEDGIVFCPTDLGVELFLWGNGSGNMPVIDFLKIDSKFSFDTEIQIPTGKPVAVLIEQARRRMELSKPTF